MRLPIPTDKRMAILSTSGFSPLPQLAFLACQLTWVRNHYHSYHRRSRDFLSHRGPSTPPLDNKSSSPMSGTSHFINWPLLLLSACSGVLTGLRIFQILVSKYRIETTIEIAGSVCSLTMTRSILSRTVRTSQLIYWALGEQDTNLFASIRYNVLNETNFIDFNIRQVYPGDLARGTPPIHFSILQDAFQTVTNKRRASRSINRVSRWRVWSCFVEAIFPIRASNSSGPFKIQDPQIIRHQQTEHIGVIARRDLWFGMCILDARSNIERYTTN